MDGNRCVFVDEMGIREADCERRYARSVKGSKACMPGRGYQTGERGIKNNFLAAMDKDGVLQDATFHMLGKVNSVRFELWVAQLLIPVLKRKYPFGGVHIVMDNAR